MSDRQSLFLRHIARADGAARLVRALGRGRARCPGRLHAGQRDDSTIERSGKAVHTIVGPSADPAERVTGVVLSLSEAELAMADAYEDEAYKRVSTRLASGREGFVYVRA